jgi:transcription-repair coupling factor (superfamily II helicase)
MMGYFIADQKSPFFESSRFTDILKFLQNNPKICVMREKDTKQGLRLLITFIHITSIQKALGTLRSI